MTKSQCFMSEAFEIFNRAASEDKWNTRLVTPGGPDHHWVVVVSNPQKSGAGVGLGWTPVLG